MPAERVRTILLVMAVVLGSCAGGSEPDRTTPDQEAALPPATAPPDPTHPSGTGGEGQEPSATPSVAGGASVTQPVEQQLPVFSPGRCPFGPPAGTEPRCGHVSVPENRDLPDSRRIRLAVAIFPALDAERYPPVLYLAGGPGGHALATIPFLYGGRFEVLNAERTLVIFDQRGVGFSDPALSCPEVLELAYDLLDEQLETEEAVARELAVLDTCRQEWALEGIDLSRYNSAESASDVADLRVALGYDEWDLFGISYGTRLALTVMRDHPEGVRSVVLDSTYPPEVDLLVDLLPNADRAYGSVFAACAADAVCASTYGDIESELFAAVDDLNASPADLRVLDVLNFEGHPALLDGDTLVGLVFESLYSDTFLPEVPRLIADVRDGHYFGVQALWSVLMANQAFLSLGHFISVECHEEVPFSDPVSVRAAAHAYPHLAGLVDGAVVQSETAFEFCREWGAGEAAPIEARPVESDIPTLVMAGGFDPITPPEYGRAVADRLENAWFVEFPTLSHGVATATGCSRSIMLAFLADPDAEADRYCVSGMAEIEFRVFEPDAEIELVPGQVGTYEVAVPQGWAGGGGVFQRDASADATMLAIIPGPPGFGDVVLDRVAGIWSAAEVQESAGFRSGDRAWRRFGVSARGLSVEAALYEGASESIVVALISDPRETTHLVEQVLMPAVESLGSTAR